MSVGSLFLQHVIERIKQVNSYDDVVGQAIYRYCVIILDLQSTLNPKSIIIENYVWIKDPRIELIIDGDTIILLYFNLALFAFKTIKNNIKLDWNNSTFEITQTKYLK